MSSSVSSIALAFVDAGIDATTIPAAPAKVTKPKRAPAKPKAKVTKPKADNAATKEGKALTALAISKAADAKAAGKVFTVTAANKKKLTAARAALVTATVAEAHAAKLAGGRKVAYAAQLAKCYGDDWHKLTMGDCESERDKARFLLIDAEKNMLRNASKEAKLANPNKPWFDAKGAQEAANEHAALVKAGIDPALRSKRDALSMKARQLKALEPLYKAHMKEGALICDKSTEANAFIGKALIALGFDLTQANLAAK